MWTRWRRSPAAHQLCFCCSLQLWCICIKAKNASRINIDQFVLKSQTFWTKMIDDWDYSIFDFDRRHIYWLVLLFGQIRLPSLFLPNMGLLIYSFGLACFLAERLICIVASVSIITWIWSGSKKKTHYSRWIGMAVNKKFAFFVDTFFGGREGRGQNT